MYNSIMEPSSVGRYRDYHKRFECCDYRDYRIVDENKAPKCNLEVLQHWKDTSLANDLCYTVRTHNSETLFTKQ